MPSSASGAADSAGGTWVTTCIQISGVLLGVIGVDHRPGQVAQVQVVHQQGERTQLVRSVGVAGSATAAAQGRLQQPGGEPGSSSSSSSLSTVSVSALSRSRSAAGGPLTESASSPRSARAFIPANTAAAAKRVAGHVVRRALGRAAGIVAGHRPPARPVDVQGSLTSPAGSSVQQTGQQLPGRSRLARCRRTAPAPRSGAAGPGRSEIRACAPADSAAGRSSRAVSTTRPDRISTVTERLRRVEAELERDQGQQIGRASSPESGPRGSGDRRCRGSVRRIRRGRDRRRLIDRIRGRRRQVQMVMPGGCVTRRPGRAASAEICGQRLAGIAGLWTTSLGEAIWAAMPRYRGRNG